jgi:hypothetical protein
VGRARNHGGEDAGKDNEPQRFSWGLFGYSLVEAG